MINKTALNIHMNLDWLICTLPLTISQTTHILVFSDNGTIITGPKWKHYDNFKTRG